MNNLLFLRKQAKLSLRNLQKYTGIDFSRLAKIEKNDSNIETKTLLKLSEFYKVSSDYLLDNGGYIEFYDEKNNKFFKLYNEQYKNVLKPEYIKTTIEKGVVKRTISLEGYKELNDAISLAKNSLNTLIVTQKFIDFLKTLNDYEFQRAMEVINDYIEIRKL